jgi:hypothetical protein
VATGREELDAQIRQMAQVAEYRAAEAERRADLANEAAEQAKADEAGISDDRYIRELVSPDEWRVIEAEYAHRLKALPADNAGLI